jgi:hypothetical protein
MAQLVARTTHRRHVEKSFIPMPPPEEASDREDRVVRRGSFRGQGFVAVELRAACPVPATPLSWIRILRTGGFASLPCGRFALD